MANFQIGNGQIGQIPLIAKKGGVLCPLPVLDYGVTVTPATAATASKAQGVPFVEILPKFVYEIGVTLDLINLATGAVIATTVFDVIAGVNSQPNPAPQPAPSGDVVITFDIPNAHTIPGPILTA